MAWNFIAGVSGAGTSPTAPIDTTGANLIVISGLYGTVANQNPFTDNKGNVWQLIRDEGAADVFGEFARIAYFCYNPIVGPNHIFTRANPTYGNIDVVAFSGASSNPLGTVTAARNNNNATTATIGFEQNLSTTGPDELMLILAVMSAEPPTASGYTLRTSVTGVSGTNYGGAILSRVAASVTSINEVVNWTTSSRPGFIFASFKGVGSSPVISTQPSDQTVTAGQTATFTVAATGDGSLAYQWRKNAVNISGANSASYTFTTVIGDDGATYSVVVSNGAGSVTSNNATLTVNAPPPAPTSTVTSNTVSGQTVTIIGTFSGSATSISAVFNPDTPANGAVTQGPVAGTLGSGTFSFTIPAVPAGRYLAPVVTITGLGGSTNSTGAPFTILGADGQPEAPAPVDTPVITAQPQSQSVQLGQAATFTVTASGTGPLSYQWRKNGASIPGANSSSYTTPATVSGDNSALFSVVVTGPEASVTSSSAMLTVVINAVTITAQPQAISVTATETATFSVTTTGTAPLSYQWQVRPSGGSFTNVSTGTGGTTAFYTTAATTVTGGSANNGNSYRVIVTNPAGSVNSAEATLTVSPQIDSTAPVLTGSITVNPVSYTSYGLSWPAASDNVGVTGYEVSVNSGTSYLSVGNVTSYTVTGRNPGSTDSVRVRAFDAAGNRSSALSTSVTLLSTTLRSQAFSNGSGQIQVGAEVNYNFVPSFRIGNTMPGLVYTGTVTTDSEGKITIINVLPGPGILLASIRATSGLSDATTDKIYYESIIVS